MSKKIKKLIFVLYTIVPFTILIIFSVRAQASVEFNSAFDFNSIGFSKYESENPVEPGFHELDLYINDSYSGRSSVYVSGYDSKRKVYVEKKEIEKYGVKEKALEKASVVVIKEKEYVSPLDLDGAVKVDLDMASLAVRLSLPQIISINNPRGWVDQEYWDEGVTAALANYNANFYRNEFAGNVNESAFSSLRFGVNLGKWQYRNQSTLRWSETTGTEYQSTQNYIQRSIPEWQTSLQLGESYTNGRFLSSVPLLGATFKTDERMLPDSVRGYAPTVRGTAETNALVRISQDGRAIYETTVSPGAFEISDLFPTSYGGDLLVTIEESDGRTRTFTVPYAAVPNLLRPGRVKYSFALGTLNDTNLSANPMIVDGVYQRGLNNFLTGSVAGQAMKDYSAVGMGLDQKSISALLDINPKTMRKFYRAELDTGVARANFNVAKSLYGRASGGKDTIASIFWLKARAGWVDTVKHSHEGLPENIRVTFALDAPKVEHEVIDVTPAKGPLIEG